MPPSDVTVAVLTYRRPDELAALLPLLLAQARDVAEAVEVLVVDNDPGAGAEGVVAAVAHERLRYVHEPVPGIAAARNRALATADGSRVLVFIDDDERPTPGWLRALLATYRGTGAAGVVGPVVSEPAGDVDPWIVAGGFFERRRLVTGDRVEVAATNNLLLDLEQVARLGVTFDHRFGLVGGSDHLFTRQLTRRGGDLVWCAEALVVDVVPAQRLTRRWVLRRAFRSGNGTSLVHVAMAATPTERARERLTLAGQGLLRLAAGSARWVVGVLVRSCEHEARGARHCARGAGLVSGALGHVVAEYGRDPHPAPSRAAVRR